MAKAVPLIAAVAGAAATGGLGAGAAFGLASGTFGFTAVNALAGAVVASAVSTVGNKLLVKKPKASRLAADASGRALSFRGSAESHKIIYGTAKVSGPLVFMHAGSEGADSAGSTAPNRYLHYILPLACHEVEGIDQIFLDDRPVNLTAQGFVGDAPYAREVETKSRPTVGIASITVTPLPDQVRGPYSPATATTLSPHGFTPGQIVSLRNCGIASFNADVVITRIQSATQFLYDAPRVFGASVTSSGGSASVNIITRSIASFVRVNKHLGGPGEPTDALLVAEAPGVWTPAHRGLGIAYLHVRFEKNDDLFPNGPPNVSAIVRGKKVFDPRNGQTYFSDNAALVIRDYLTSRDGSALNEPYGFGIENGRIDDASVVAAANICSENVLKKDGSTQARYPCNGVVDTANGRLDNLSQLLTSCAGTVAEVQDRFRVHVAAYSSPVMDITPDHLAGDIRVRTQTPRRELFNTVKGVFVDPAKGWQPTDFPPVTSAFYQAQDNGEVLARDVELPFTIDPEGAQRLGRILLEKNRQGITCDLTANHACIGLSVWDVVTVTNPIFGWSGKPFRVTEWAMDAAGPITLKLQEESAASYDWNRGMALAYDPAPDTNLPNPLVVLPPGAITVDESLYVTRSGDGVKAKITLSWGESPDPFVDRYQAEYRSGPNAWSILPRTIDTRIEIEDIAPGFYEFRVKAINTQRVSSPYSTASKQVSALLEPPREPQNLTISTIGGMALLRWDQFALALDVKIGGRIVFRHSPDVAAGWAQSTTIGDALPGSSTVAVLPLKPGIYLAKAVDSSGTESIAAASVRTDQATAVPYANVTSLAEHSTFPGIKHDVAVIGGILRLASGTNVSALDPISSASPTLALSGGVKSMGAYEFSGAIDLGSAQPVRLTAHLKVAIVNQFDTIRSRSNSVSSWGSVTAADVAEGDARVYVRVTSDDPAGSPDWGDWQRLDSAEFHCRAIEAECRLMSYDPAYNVLVSELSLHVDKVI